MKKSVLLLLLSALFTCGSVYAQLRVTGTVLDAATGEPMAGASVIEQGTTSGTTTDTKGRFAISVKNHQSVLTFSFIGMVPQNIMVGSNTDLRVELQQDVTQIENVVVQIGYGDAQKKNVAGSLGVLSTSEITKSKGTSFMDALQGRMAGVQVNSSSGEPGAGIDITIRGGNSINAGTQPLYIIDDVQIDVNADEVATSSYTSANVRYNPLAGINPSDIESITVLKDASATAIYGSRGANGVIMVTTKGGRKEHHNVWFSGKVGVGVFSDKLDYWRDPVQMARLENESYENGGAEGPYTGKIWSDGTYYPSIAEIESGEWPFRTKWADHVFRTSVTQDYSIGIEGSGEKNRYYVSLGYYNGEGMQHKDDFEKYTVDMSYDHMVARSINLKTKAGFVRGFRTYNNGTSYGRNPLWPVYNGDGSYFKSQAKDYGNPVMINNEIKNESDNMSGYALVQADWTIIPVGQCPRRTASFGLLQPAPLHPCGGQL